MIISLNWLKKFTNIDVSVDELIELIGARLVEVENVVNLGDKYKGVIIARVIDSQKMPDSDHLSIVKLDDGGVVAEVERDKNGYVQVVCGAPNMRSDITVVWLPPGVTVPSTYGTAEEFVLDSRNLRGVKSNGMVASAKELDLSDDHTGILEISDDIAPGTSFAKAYELDDYLLNIENKSLTHRPDCFGVVGFAREISAIIGQKFITPDWLGNTSTYPNPAEGDINLHVSIDNPELSPRYQVVVLDNADRAAKSSLLIQTYLSRSGIRPISAIVDVTNYLMLLTGQPLHAFDYDKLLAICGDNVDIHVRAARDGEKLELLDGKIIELSVNDIVIAAGEQAIALAGAMGGISTAIDDDTTRIVIESASFNLYNLRGTQMRHGIFSEAITRFTKGQPAELTLPVIRQALQMIIELTGARQVSNIIEDYPGKTDRQPLNVRVEKINSVLGTDYSIDSAKEVLERVDLGVLLGESGELTIHVPYWRNDLEITEDLAEEIGRIVGFDNINPTLPKRDFTAIKPSDFDMFRMKLRNLLSKAGANETLSYSFVHGDILKKAGQIVDNSYRLVNSISPELQYYRQSLTPSILTLTYMNAKQGFDRFAIYEMNKVHNKSDGINEESVPIESNAIALTFTDKNLHNAAPYYQAKKILDYILKSLGVEGVYQTPEDDSISVIAPFEKIRSAQVNDKESGKLIGVVGEYKKSVINSFKLPEYSSGFEINIDILFDVYKKVTSSYKPQAKYPGTERDICFKVSNDVRYSQIINAIKSAPNKDNIGIAIEPADIYQADGSDTKNITIRVKITALDHTLDGVEVADIIKNISSLVITATNATVI